MQEIETALLAGQRKINLFGMEIDLNPPLKPNTRKFKEKEAKERAKKIMKLVRS